MSVSPSVTRKNVIDLTGLKKSRVSKMIQNGELLSLEEVYGNTKRHKIPAESLALWLAVKQSEHQQWADFYLKSYDELKKIVHPFILPPMITLQRHTVMVNYGE